MFEYVVKTPFDMKPSFAQCSRPVFNIDDIDEDIKSQRVIELEKLGDNIWFETSVAQDSNLACKASETL